MIEEFVRRFDAKRAELRARFAAAHPEGYEDIVRAVVEAIAAGPDAGAGSPDPERVRCIDDGNDSGTLCFVIGEVGHLPCRYWAVLVGYGSCSACDAFTGIRYLADGDVPTPEQAEGYTALAVHVVQRLCEIGPCWP